MVTADSGPPPRVVPRLALVTVVIAALLYLVGWRRTFVGFYYDDADYILSALALIHGRFHSPRLPGVLVWHAHWPGFSLVLAPLLPLVQPHWACLKTVPLLCVLGCVGLLMRWWRSTFSGWTAMLAPALFAWNPTTVERATAVMSEPLFLLCLLGTIVGLKEHSPGRRPWGIGVLLVTATLVRPEGVLLAFATVAALYLWGEEREALIAGAPLLALGVLCTGLCLAGLLTAPAYWSDWVRNAPAVNGRELLQQAGVQLLTFFPGIFFNAPQPHNRLLFIGGMGLSLFGVFLAGLGVWMLWQQREERVPTAGLLLFVALYFLAHVFWPVVDRRFLWIIFPAGIYWVLAAGTALAQGRPRLGVAMHVALGLLLVSYLTSTLAARLSPARLPRRSLAWLQTHTASSARLLTNNPGMLYLYTGRSALGLPPEGFYNAATFYYACLAEHATALCYLPGAEPSANLPLTQKIISQWEASEGWAQTRVYAFQRIFAEPSEGVSVYRVTPNRAYLQAYRLYISAMADFANQKPVWGTAKIGEVLREDRQFPEALIVYGATLLAQGHSTEAAPYFAEARRLDPTLPLTLSPQPQSTP